MQVGLDIKNYPVCRLSDIVNLDKKSELRPRHWENMSKVIRIVSGSGVLYAEPTEYMKNIIRGCKGVTALINNYNDELNIITVLDIEGSVIERFKMFK